jgi:phospholipase A1
VRAEQPQGLRWYAQWFTGYGASLLDYNLRQTSLGLGVSLFEF